MDNTASITALMLAFVRAYHTERATNPVFTDKIARKLMSDEEYGRIKDYILGGINFFAPEKKGSFGSDDKALEWIVNTQLAPTPLARARYCDGCLETERRSGAEQYVILGAGLDTFPWRKPELMDKLDVFEVDHPLTQEDKKRRIAEAGLKIPDRLHFAAADLSCDDLAEKLLEAGFDENKKTFFSCLGLSFYLTEEQIGQMLERISSFAAEGSSLLFDYGDEGLFTAAEKRVQNMLAMAEAGGERMKFCAGEMELTALLERHHFLIYELLSAGDIEGRFFAGRDDGLSAFEHISFALTVIKGTQFIGTKEKILRTALRLFAKNGYEAVSVSMIAGELGMTKGALYRHYASKRDIFDSILERMAQKDREYAERYEMPEEPYNRGGEGYGQASEEKIKVYTQALFRHWTEENFSADFRKMLTLEQYREPEMSELYQQYLAAGPMGYMADMFRETAGSEAEAKRFALEFYGPVCLLYSVYDGGGDKSEIWALLSTHLDNFLENISRRNGGKCDEI